MGCLTESHKALITVVDMTRLEAFVPHWHGLPGRPLAERAALSRSFVAKAVLNLPTARMLIERVEVDKTLRRLCGWSRPSEVPSESTFSRAFAELAQSAGAEGLRHHRPHQLRWTQHPAGLAERGGRARGQMREKSLFVSQQQIVAGVEFMSFREAEVGAEEIGHGAVAEPLAMQAPLAARRDEPVGRQHLQHVIPARALATLRQTLGPEAIEPQLAPQNACEPTRPPTAGVGRAASRTIVDGSRRRRTSQRSSGNSATERDRPRSSSNTSIALRQASAFEELISPR